MKEKEFAWSSDIRCRRSLFPFIIQWFVRKRPTRVLGTVVKFKRKADRGSEYYVMPEKFFCLIKDKTMTSSGIDWHSKLRVVLEKLNFFICLRIVFVAAVFDLKIYLKQTENFLEFVSVVRFHSDKNDLKRSMMEWYAERFQGCE